MKILFVGDYSGLHATLAAELRRRGHDVTLLSDGGRHMKVRADILLDRNPGIKGSLKYLYDIFAAMPRLSGFDVVQFINPGFLRLKPGKLRYFLRQLQDNNGKMFLTLAGADHFYVRASTDCHTFPFSDWRIGTEKTRYAVENRLEEEAWLDHHLEDYTRFFYDHMAGAMSTLYEYHVAAMPHFGDRLAYTGLAVDTTSLATPLPDFSGKLRLLVGMLRGREVLKGTDILLDIARSIEAEMPGRIVVDTATNLDWNTYMQRVRQSHLVFDQLYAMSPALNALQTMASGRLTVSGASQPYYDLIGEPSLRPVIAADPIAAADGSLRNRLLEILSDPDEMMRRAEEGVQLAKNHNNVALVADKFLDVWTKN